jgi:hypothetical protein
LTDAPLFIASNHILNVTNLQRPVVALSLIRFQAVMFSEGSVDVLLGIFRCAGLVFLQGTEAGRDAGS